MTSTHDSTAAALDPSALEQLRRQLQAERDELVVVDDVVGDADEDTDLTDDPGTRLAERETIATLTNLQAGQLEQIDAALTRLDDGTYGSCAACGAAIPVERLEIVPTAEYCVGCQERHAG